MSNRPGNRPNNTWVLVALCAILLLAVALRVPGINGTFNGLHDWKNIRHYQFAVSMLETGNLIFGQANFTQPEDVTPWFWSVTEAPWVTWSLVGLFQLFKPSIELFQIYFVLVDVFTIVLFFIVMRRIVGHWLALFGTLIYTVTPVCVAFAGYSLGEAFLKWGLLLWTWAAYRFFSEPLSRRNNALYILTCANLAMCKLTTGVLMGGAAMIIWACTIAWRKRDSIRAFRERRRVLFTLLGTMIVLVPLVAVGGFFHLLSAQWLKAKTPIFDPDYYPVFYQRWIDYIGVAPIVLGILGLVVYGVRLVVLLWKNKKPGFTHEHRVALALLLIALFQWLGQAKAYIPHEYYMNVFVIPTLVVIVIFFHRLALLRSRVPLAVVLFVFVALAAWRMPARYAMIQYLYSVENVSPADQKMLQEFFKLRSYRGKKQFIIADQPRWAWHAGVNIHLVDGWETLLTLLHRDPDSIYFLKKLNVPYLLLPRHSALASPGLLDKLENNVLLDNGPKYFKLGVVLRGNSFFLLKITDGIKYTVPVQRKGGPLWFASEENFKPVPGAGVPASVYYESSDMGHGALYTNPFVGEGDALTYRMQGSVDPAIHVDLYRDGELIYTQRPTRRDANQRYTLDIGEFWMRPLMLSLVDSMAWTDSHLKAGNFEMVTFSDPFK